MKKSTLIANFLVNLRSGVTLEHGEQIVADTFADTYPNHNFYDWNSELDDARCDDLISQNQSLGHVNVDQFIRELWDAH